MKIAIKSYISGKYFSAEYGGGIYPGLALTANRDEIKGYETFEEVPQSGGKFALQTYTGHYLTADIDGSLRTNELAVGDWEKFDWDGEFIITHHGKQLTARIDEPLIPVKQTDARGDWERFDRIPLEVAVRRGLVRADGRCVKDDDGLFHPLGLTFFWALYGWKFERDRIHEHLAWLQQHNFDYLRILGEVDWDGRSIEPFGWSDYQNILAEFLDTAYGYGLRSELTLVGGQYREGHEELIPDVLRGREHTVIHLEVCNEWTRLDKISNTDLIRVGSYLREYTPHLVALSRPDEELGYQHMINMSKEADVNMYTAHLRRSDHDNKWSHVRQGYDLKEFPNCASNNEPQGPQSSVDTLDNPMQLAMARACGIVCNGPFYVLHVGQGVTGEADPEHGRPQNMWEVPNIDQIMKSVRAIDDALPLGIENWKCVNNGRDDHPMPLPSDAFWEGHEDGKVNKNYACINGDKFVEVLLGVKTPEEKGPQDVGKLEHNSNLRIYNAEDMSVQTLSQPAGTDVIVEGRADTMKGYVVIGNISDTSKRRIRTRNR